jgi:hypothetical protein
MISEENKAEEDVLAEEQEKKKAVVTDTIAGHCNESSPFEDLRTIGAALKAGDKLLSKIIAGGKTNFSYKVYVEGSPDKALFAKICFSYALWNPDRSVHYDVVRTENEFKVMKQFADMMGGDNAPIATPYLCIKVSETERVLVTEWAPADEQWANQFIDGEVDHRIIPKVAEAFATLNCATDFDPMFNNGVRDCMLNLFPQCKMTFAEVISTPGQIDQCVALMKEIGQEAWDSMVDNMSKEYMKREALVHHDSHMFNLLVEKKPSAEKLQKFGPEAILVICDWEMAFAGPIGGDPGKLQFWPICCALCHAVQGHKVEAYDIIEAMNEFWDAYAKAMVEKGGKDKEFLLKTYRSALGWAGMMIFPVAYLMGIFRDVLPLEGVPEAEGSQAIGAFGVVGLKFMRWGFGDYETDLTMDELRGRFNDTIGNEIESLLEVTAARRVRPRRASVLRAQGRRISDASLYEESARRLSADPAAKRGSVFDIGTLHLSELVLEQE